MKAATLRSFLAVHTWVGLVAGMALFIAFYAGAITVFADAVQQWGPAQQAEPSHDSPAQAQALIDAVLKQHPQAAEDFSVGLPGEGDGRLRLSWYQPPADGKPGQLLRYRLDSAGQAVEQPANLPSPSGLIVSGLVNRLHFTLGLPRLAGEYLLGVVCILYGLALVSGVVIYAPGFMKDLFALRVGRNLKRMWQDAHNVIGVLSLPFHVLFAWSGVVLTIGSVMLAPFQFLVFQNTLLDIVRPDFQAAADLAPAHISAPLLPANELIARARAAIPGLAVDFLSYDNAGDVNARVTVYGDVDQRSLFDSGQVVMNASTGDIVRVLQPKDYSPGRAFYNGLRVLHFAEFGGVAMRWLYFVLGLAGAFLFYSGNLLWIEARRKRRQIEQPRSTRVMAALTLGVCLGCVAGVSAIFLAGVLLPQAWVMPAYYAVFFASLFWTAVRRPARAGHDLLWACAVLTAAIPLADWIGSAGHLSAALRLDQGARFLVDATALVLAYGYWRMARAVLRRGRDGDPNSVWTLR